MNISFVLFPQASEPSMNFNISKLSSRVSWAMPTLRQVHLTTQLYSYDETHRPP